MVKHEPVFPAPRTVAEMRPHSHTIHLHEISAKEFGEKLRRKDFIALAHDLEVIVHELTHWFDLVGTVWGQDYINKIYTAYDALERPSEATFRHFIELFDEDRRVLLPRYYHTVVESSARHHPGRPWQMTLGTGLEFSPDGILNHDRPILFVLFGDHDSGKRVARQPITVGSLIETCAIWSELATVVDTLSQVADDEGKVESRLWSREKTALLYGPAYTQYVAPAHLLSVNVGTKDPFLTFERASGLARVCLNLTPAHFGALRHPVDFDPFGQERRNAFIANRDRGYAFAAIVYAAPLYDPCVDTDTWLARALQAAGLPDVSTLRRDALTYLSSLHVAADLAPQTRSLLENIRRIGLIVSKASGTGETNGFTFGRIIEDQIPTPRMFDSECNFLDFPTVIDGADHDPTLMFEAEHRLRAVTQNVLIGCRGFPEY